MSTWHDAKVIPSYNYQCGRCGFNVASNNGYWGANGNLRIYICPHCDRPTFFEPNVQIPGVSPGENVAHLPDSLEALYRETRNACAAGAYTSSVLASRKMLMNIAVAQGAADGLKFIEYVEYLTTKGFVPPNGRGWVDHIRKKGNEATHEIALMNRGDAEELITFLTMLLKFVYEFPARVPTLP